MVESQGFAIIGRIHVFDHAEEPVPLEPEVPAERPIAEDGEAGRRTVARRLPTFLRFSDR
jgi:hypothetical protein